jgi:FkbM family methyltransferase
MSLPPYLCGDRRDLEHAAEERARAVFVGGHTVLCRALGKYLVYADSDDIGIVPHLCLDGFWESWVTVAMARVLQPGWRCVDVGANHGYYTLLMADAVGPSGRVLAIEPNPKLVDLLNLSLEVNGLMDRVSVVGRAAFDAEPDKVELVVPRRRGLNGTVCRSATPFDDVIPVDTITVDRAISDWPIVHFAKIDAEGAERAIWSGMRETIARNYDIIVIMEFAARRYADAAAFLGDVVANDFRLRYIDYDGSIKDVTEEDVLFGRFEREWMLYLRRGSD